MTMYKIDCHKCTNVCVNLKGDKWCRAIVEGRKGCYIESGDCGKNFVLNCDEYTTKPQQAVLYGIQIGENR